MDPLARAAALAPAPGALAVPVRQARPLPLSVALSAVAPAVAPAVASTWTLARGTPLGTAVNPAAAAAPATGPVPPAAASPAGHASAAQGGGTLLGRPMPGFPPDATRVAPAAVASALGNFVREQLASPRVEGARATADAPLKDAFVRAGLTWPAPRIYLRAFKREHQLEVWGQRTDGSYALVKTFAICSLGGSALGPKVRRGDEQVPEGFYHVIQFNPSSEYHLSLRLDYPNAADMARAAAMGDNAGDLGGDIYLHGGCKSAGCLPLTDAGIEQIYWLSVQARAAGEREIPIDIFPARLDAADWDQLSNAFAARKNLLAFWSQLKQGYDAFERTHRLPDVAIDAHGHYVVALGAH